MAKRKRGSGKAIASVLITALIVGGIGFASSGFSKWDKEDWEARLIPERVFYRSVSIDLSNVTLNDFEEQAVSEGGVSGFLYTYRVDPEIIIQMYGGETQLTEIDFISPNREEVTHTPNGYEKVFVISRKTFDTPNGPKAKKIWDFKVNGIEIVLNSEFEQTKSEIYLTSPKDADGNYLPIQTITFKEALEF